MKHFIFYIFLFVFVKIALPAQPLNDTNMNLPNRALARNFAEVIINPSKDKFIAIFEIHERLSDEIHKKSKQSWFKSPLGSAFQDERFRIISPDITYAYCIEVDPIIYLKDELTQMSQIDHMKTVPICAETKWLAVLETMYDANGKLMFYNDIDAKGFEGIEKYDFINKESFFRIPLPQADNALCLKWNPDLGFEPGSNIFRAGNDLVEDIKKLSALFCNRKYELLDAIELIQKQLPTLQSKTGNLVAEEMMRILEQKVIKSLDDAVN